MKIQQKWKLSINFLSLLVQSAIPLSNVTSCRLFSYFFDVLSFSSDLQQGLICVFVSLECLWRIESDSENFWHVNIQHIVFFVVYRVAYLNRIRLLPNDCQLIDAVIFTAVVSVKRPCPSLCAFLDFFLIALFKVIMIWFGWRYFWSLTCVVILRRVEIHVFFFPTRSKERKKWLNRGKMFCRQLFDR